jgi:hypothetical protein
MLARRVRLLEADLKAPKGRDAIAWGTAPRNQPGDITSPERATYRATATTISPFQGWSVFSNQYPARCAGLLHDAPSGLQ